MSKNWYEHFEKKRVIQRGSLWIKWITTTVYQQKTNNNYLNVMTVKITMDITETSSIYYLKYVNFGKPII